MPNPFELVPYDSTAICSKCHCTHVATQIIPADEICLHARIPHMHRKCERCGNHWGETPIQSDVGDYDYLRSQAR